MSTYVSLYRKYRPQQFGDLVGQGQITRILQNALETGRVAHAYLFCGPRGTGKTTTARLLAKALNCDNGPTRDPCNACGACERITAGSALDVIEIDAASNRGIDDIRELRDKVKYAPAEARHKVYVIDECHMLTTEAFNALLKTLEEPPPHVLFILATTDPQKVPATILSRCQRMDFRRGRVSDLVERLTVVAKGEDLEIEEEALLLIARAGDGSWRDSLSILEQIVAFGARRVTGQDVRGILGTVSSEILFDCARAIAGKDAARALTLVGQIAEEGKDIRDFLRGLMAHFRNLLLVGASGGAVLPDGATAEEARVLTEQAQSFPAPVCIRALESLSEAEKEMRRDSQHRLLLELAVLRLVSEPAQPAAPAAAPEPVYEARPARIATPEAMVARPAPLSREPEPVRLAPVAPSMPAQSVEPPAAPARVAASGDGSVTLEDVLAAWPLIKESVRSVKLKGVLSSVRPARLTGRELMLMVPPGHQFHLDQLEKPESLRLLQEATQRAVGADLVIRVRMGDHAGDAAPTVVQAGGYAPPVDPVPARAPVAAIPAPAPAPAGALDPYDADTISVKDVLDTFGGRIIQGGDER